MRDCTPSFEQSGGAEDKRSSADRGYIARSRSLPPDEIQRSIGIGKKRVHATATRYADSCKARCAVAARRATVSKTVEPVSAPALLLQLADQGAASGS